MLFEDRDFLDSLPRMLTRPILLNLIIELINCELLATPRTDSSFIEAVLHFRQINWNNPIVIAKVRYKYLLATAFLSTLIDCTFTQM